MVIISRLIFRGHSLTLGGFEVETRVFRGRNIEFRGEGRIFAAETLTRKAKVECQLGALVG